MRLPWWMVRASLMAGAGLCLVSCTPIAPSTQSARRYFVPPSAPLSAKESQPIDPPPVTLSFFANEVPTFTSSLPSVPRPTDVDFLIRRSDDRFSAGKRAVQEGRIADARREFDQALTILLTAPENVTDRTRLDRRIEDLIESIHRYDVGQLGAGEEQGDDVHYEKSPIDDILQMTFPVDPRLRNKVQEQIRATASQLPLEVSDPVVSYINFFSSERGKKILTYGLRRAGRYKPMIERVLAEEGVPQELIFLAQAESGFTPRAMSRAKCVGIWQFAAFRGREYGLFQTAATDDRMDPDRATRAAARHLRDLYDHFGDWYLAMAAYNCGPGCVDRAVQRTGYADFWQLRRLNVLPKETANYVPAILAMTIMAKNAADYNLADVVPDSPLEYETVEVDSPTHLALIAEAVDRPLGELRELNPSLLRLVAPPGHAIHVPKGTLDQLQDALKVVPANQRNSWRVHRMEAGESLTDLAKRFNVSPAALTAANSEEFVEPGNWVAIPVSYPGDKMPVQASKTAAAKRKSGTSKAAAAKRTATASTSRKTAKPVTQSKGRGSKPNAAVTYQTAPPRS